MPNYKLFSKMYIFVRVIIVSLRSLCLVRMRAPTLILNDICEV